MYKARFLVDTDIIINYLKGMENARDFLMRIIDESASGFFSVITEAELLSGSRNSDDESAIIQYWIVWKRLRLKEISPSLPES